MSLLLSSVASGEGWPILPGPAPRGWICSRRDSDPLAAQAMSHGGVLWLVRTCIGSSSVEFIVLVKLSSVRNHNYIGMSSRGRLVPVLVGVDVVTKIITYECH
jgi:hypothetical protein